MRVAWKKKWGMVPVWGAVGTLGLVGIFTTQVLNHPKDSSHEIQSELSKFSQTLRTSSQASKYVLTESDRALLQKQGLLKSEASPALKSLLQ